ncbi:MAG: 4'-phosphopantetheinyl transferase family protein [Thermoanaerobaculia bacterium]
MTIPWALLVEMPQDSAEEPAWLGRAERRILANLCVPKRRADWLLGRYAAKSVVARLLGDTHRIDVPLESIDIVAEASGAPAVRLGAAGAPAVGVTISHSGGRAFSAAWTEGAGGISVGVDLEEISTRSSALVHDFFCSEEIDAWKSLLPGGPRDTFATAVWSAKEAVSKALRVGLAVDTRSVGILLAEKEAAISHGLPRPYGGFWKSFEALVGPEVPGGGRALAGFWREQEGFVLTMAVAGPASGERGRRAA